jgi:DNA-directed RNA polymerase omega subunit
MYKLPKNLPSKYEFVTLASKRAEQLQMGAPARVGVTAGRKATVIAQEEVATGAVSVWTPDDEDELLDELEEEE